MDMYQKIKMRAENKKSNNQESLHKSSINWDNLIYGKFLKKAYK